MLDPKEKARRYRERMLTKAKEFRPSTYRTKYVAGTFQRMIRAEYAARPDGFEPAVVKGIVEDIPRYSGECVCVTCGTVTAWDAKQMNCGHFIGGRTASIVFEETNVAPQCAHCNSHLSGAPAEYQLWIETMYGRDEVDRLRRLKSEVVKFTIEELVDKRIYYMKRLKAAVSFMQEGLDSLF